MKDKKEIIKLWNELNIDHINFNFSCGGDSMGDTDIEIFDKDGEIIKNSDLHDYFDSDIYNRVDFYVNSDGHYIGESGYVEITLVDDEEGYFSYCKIAESEFSENFTGIGVVTLTDEERSFIAEYVDNINGGDNDFNINYKKDFILTDELEKLVEELKEKICDFASDFYPEEAQGEPNDWVTYTTNEDGDDLVIDDNGLNLHITREYIVYSESE